MNTLIFAIISFFIGNVSGFFFAKLLAKDSFNFNVEDRINWLIAVVSIVWIISVLVDIASPEYETSPLIHGIMGAIVGFFFWRPKA